MRVVAEVDLGIIADNFAKIRRYVKKDAKILAVVKADAYGHGIFEVSKTLVESGADFLGVAAFFEGKALREQGINSSILILGAISDEEYEGAVNYGISLTVFDLETAKKISSAAQKIIKTANIHIKIDTGMTRIGYDYNDEKTIEEIVKISKLPFVKIEGVFSHFSKADETDRSYTNMQFERFSKVCSQLEKKGVNIPLKHICNSGGIINYPDYHLDMVRSGIITYGHFPSDYVDKDAIKILPAMTFKCMVVSIKDVLPDTLVGYGGEFKTTKKMKIATVSVGYADGYFRKFSNKGHVLINGNRYKVVGNVCMDQMMVDITGSDNIKLGDDVILFGKSGNNIVTVEEIAKDIGTINYEILCAVSKRVPRAYIKAKSSSVLE